MPGFPVHHQLLELAQIRSIQLVIPSNYLILCHPLLLLPLIFPSNRVFSNESVLCIRWPKYWRFSFSIILSIILPNILSYPFFPSYLLGTPIIQMLICVMLSQRSLRMSSCLFICSSLFCLASVISSILSSSSLICSASVLLLLVPSSVFLISVIADCLVYFF